MKSKLLFDYSGLGLLALLAMTTGSLAQAQGPRPPHYTVTDLGVLDTGNNSSGFDMNSVGWVGGSSNLTSGGPQHAFLWYGGGPLKSALRVHAPLWVSRLCT